MFPWPFPILHSARSCLIHALVSLVQLFDVSATAPPFTTLTVAGTLLQVRVTQIFAFLDNDSCDSSIVQLALLLFHSVEFLCTSHCVQNVRTVSLRSGFAPYIVTRNTDASALVLAEPLRPLWIARVALLVPVWPTGLFYCDVYNTPGSRPIGLAPFHTHFKLTFTSCSLC